jgi:hypothetical protein
LQQRKHKQQVLQHGFCTKLSDKSELGRTLSDEVFTSLRRRPSRDKFEFLEGSEKCWRDKTALAQPTAWAV